MLEEMIWTFLNRNAEPQFWNWIVLKNSPEINSYKLERNNALCSTRFSQGIISVVVFLVPWS